MATPSARMPGQGMERALALVLEVVGQVDRGHAAFTKLTLDGVAAF